MDCRRNPALSLFKGHSDRLVLAPAQYPTSVRGFQSPVWRQSWILVFARTGGLRNGQLAHLCSDVLAEARLASPSPLCLQPCCLLRQSALRPRMGCSPGAFSAHSLSVFTRISEQVEPWLQEGRDGPHQMGMLTIACPSLDVCLRVAISIFSTEAGPLSWCYGGRKGTVILWHFPPKYLALLACMWRKNLSLDF